jgi:ATP-dependent Zn protease
MEHCQRPWWKRPPVWVISILVIVLALVAVMEQTGKQATEPYSSFLDQIEAGRIASVTFNGMEVLARLKVPASSSLSADSAQHDMVRSRVPDFGDPTLIAELRRQRVAIEVTSPSAWTWLLGRLPWPMLIVIGVVLVAGFVRFLRGGNLPPGSTSPMPPAHGLIGLLAGFFAKPRQTMDSDRHGGDEPMDR